VSLKPFWSLATAIVSSFGDCQLIAGIEAVGEGPL
jgi:hypothetical protein